MQIDLAQIWIVAPAAAAPRLTPEQQQKALITEHGGMNEVLANRASELLGGVRWADALDDPAFEDVGLVPGDPHV